ncbi:hypothetical protein [Nannocystis sp. SCPEA4]|uniref:hypothetical protein n=1 Tax=Nannocystis sp. SCPEA4 TaxID=2996787 RepID=UPI00227058CD|nr:hypothetical protein [Nannocystis sp. SCPEA4]MCY1059169.1 hypothetical protein [Nannocystis sp. SCPEA4]
MGTWDDGLYDNDSALDLLHDLVEAGDDAGDPARIVARLGLRAWLNPVSVAPGDRLQAIVDALDDAALATFPEPTRVALAALFRDPEKATKKSSRTRKVTAILGGYSDGPRIDPLLRFPGAAPVLEELAERCAVRLDRTLARKVDLYEVAGDLAALGVLIELTQADLWRPDPARVTRWRLGFDAIDAATTEERGFWWKYVRRVRNGFELIAPGTAPPKSAPIRRKPAPPPPPFEPVERFLHPKFGAATLVNRTRSGGMETLELCFDDGEVRKVLAHFVTRLAR